jgi:hypothetical protein
MKSRTFQLEERTYKMLQDMSVYSGYSMNDIVHIALEVLHNETLPKAMIPYVKEKVYAAIFKQNKTVENWCIENAVNIKHLHYCLRRIAKGHTLYDGDTNKWRAKNDDRMYKTHTAYVAERIRVSLGIDLQNITSETAD